MMQEHTRTLTLDEIAGESKKIQERETIKPSSPYQMVVLQSLQGKNIYAGTVDPVEVQRRRAANKRARKQRKLNRRKK